MKQTSQDEKIVLRKAAFRSWLVANRDVTVGYACESGSCPLSRWVQDVYHVSCDVNVDIYEVSGSITHTLPAWSKLFVRLLDFTYTGNEVTGAQALTLLDG